MDFRYEMTIIPVTDVDRAKEFYEERMGFHLDVDHKRGETFRVVQLTPPGSAASISFGVGISSGEPGSYKGMHLVVDDIEAAHEELAGRGVEIGEPFHFGAEGRMDGVDPERSDYNSFLSVEDPDGNMWMIQEVPSRAG